MHTIWIPTKIHARPENFQQQQPLFNIENQQISKHSHHILSQIGKELKKKHVQKLTNNATMHSWAKYEFSISNSEP